MASVNDTLNGIGSILDNAANRYIDTQMPEPSPTPQPQVVKAPNATTTQPAGTTTAVTPTGSLWSDIKAHMNVKTISIAGGIILGVGFLIHKFG